MGLFNPLQQQVPMQRGLLGADIDPNAQPMTGPAAPIQQKKRGIFGGLFDSPEGSDGFNVNPKLAIISQILSGMSGKQSPAYAIWAAQQQQHRAEQLAAANRENDFTDWQRKQEWTQQNPTAPNNDTVADFNFWKQTLPPEQFNTWLQNKINPPQYRQGPDGQFYRMDTGQGGGGAAAPSFTEDDWNSGQPVGGAPQQGMPPFADPMRAPGHMTSGRRTVEGNMLVGGKPNSRHLSGDAADYVGATPAQLQSYFGPQARVLQESDHVHATLPGYGKVPYFGKRGTTGLRN